MKEAGGRVVLVRHAESEWDRENRFIGWADPALSERGIEEAHQAGQLLRQAGFRFDHSYSSRLQRASHTLDILLHEIGQERLDRGQEWRLNARHCGALQGEKKCEISRQVGREQLERWRRGYLDLPPPLHSSDPRHPANNPTYVDIPAAKLPAFENLDLTRERAMAFWGEQVVPRLVRGETILISSHGDTLRVLIMALDGMSTAEVEKCEIPTAAPIVYHFNSHARPIGWRYLDETHCLDCAA